KELAEIGVLETRVQMRLYHADFRAEFEDVRGIRKLHDPLSYAAPQEFARDLMMRGVNGLFYRSVRRPGGECIACFRTALVLNVRIGAHFEYRWQGRPTPEVRRL